MIIEKVMMNFINYKTNLSGNKLFEYYNLIKFSFLSHSLNPIIYSESIFNFSNSGSTCARLSPQNDSRLWAVLSFCGDGNKSACADLCRNRTVGVMFKKVFSLTFLNGRDGPSTGVCLLSADLASTYEKPTRNVVSAISNS